MSMHRKRNLGEKWVDIRNVNRKSIFPRNKWRMNAWSWSRQTHLLQNLREITQEWNKVNPWVPRGPRWVPNGSHPGPGSLGPGPQSIVSEAFSPVTPGGSGMKIDTERPSARLYELQPYKLQRLIRSQRNICFQSKVRNPKGKCLGIPGIPSSSRFLGKWSFPRSQAFTVRYDNDVKVSRSNCNL